MIGFGVGGEPNSVTSGVYIWNSGSIVRRVGDLVDEMAMRYRHDSTGQDGMWAGGGI